MTNLKLTLEFLKGFAIGIPLTIPIALASRHDPEPGQENDGPPRFTIHQAEREWPYPNSIISMEEFEAAELARKERAAQQPAPVAGL